jgi:hypothetical protein
VPCVNVVVYVCMYVCSCVCVHSCFNICKLALPVNCYWALTPLNEGLISSLCKCVLIINITKKIGGGSLVFQDLQIDKHEQPGQTKGLGSLYSYCTVTRNFGVYVKMPKDHSSYFWGLYVNPNDERTFVPKAGQTTYFPLGATINLSHTEGKLFMTALGTVLAWSFFGMYRDSRR